MVGPKLTPSEIFDYFDSINCIQDIQTVADYLNDYKEDYTAHDFELLRVILYDYINLWV